MMSGKQLAYRSLRFGCRLIWACGILGGLLLLVLSKPIWAVVVFVLGIGSGILIDLVAERVRHAQWRVVYKHVAELMPVVKEIANQHAQDQGAEVHEFEFHPYSAGFWDYWRWWHGKVGQSPQYRFMVKLDIDYGDAIYDHKEPVVNGYVVSRVEYRHDPNFPVPQGDGPWGIVGWYGPFEPSEGIRTADLTKEGLLAALQDLEVAGKKMSDKMSHFGCPYCRAVVSDDDNYCGKCGALLPSRGDPGIRERLKKVNTWIDYGKKTNNPWEAADMLFDHAWKECLEPLLLPPILTPYETLRGLIATVISELEKAATRAGHSEDGGSRYLRKRVAEIREVVGDKT